MSCITGFNGYRVVVAVTLSLCCVYAALAASPSDRFRAIVKDYVDSDLRTHPIDATSRGFHDGDSKLDDVSADAHRAEAARLHHVSDALKAIDPAALPPMERDDREVLLAAIDGDLLEEESTQLWRHDPERYVGLVSTAIYSLIERDFAPVDQRIKAVIAREQGLRALLKDVEANLVDMPPEFIDIGLEDLEGTINFISKDVPAAFTDVDDQKAKARLVSATVAAVDALEVFKSLLESERADAHGNFRLGPARFQRLLASDLVNVPAADVLAAGKAQLLRDQVAFESVAKLINPAHPDAALTSIEQDHPDGPGLVPMARSQLAALRDFIVAHHIVTLPSDAMPVVTETPVFMRASIFGALDPPGPLETHATKAYFYITPPDPSESQADQDKYLAYFNRSMLQNLAVHEALPGHFVQFLVASAHPEWSLVRKLAGSYTATEGWAHYTEQMMLDAGLGDAAPPLRLAQLQDALLRDCRLIASVSMHTEGMSLADATAMMQKDCHQPADVAAKEARRGTDDPGYFSYALGKLEILKLRHDVEQRDGKDFSLGHFHDQFLAAGLVPIAIIRREIMGADGPPL